jgi:hypothetical protein
MVARAGGLGEVGSCCLMGTQRGLGDSSAGFTAL